MVEGYILMDRTIRLYCIGLRRSVCVRILVRDMLISRDQAEAVYYLLSLD
jgi:hypothetical protein